MVATRTKLKVGDRIAIRGEIEKLFDRGDRVMMTVLVPRTPPITLDASYANRATDTLRITDEVILEGRIQRIAGELVSIHLDGYAYRVTLGAEDIEKVSR